MTRHEAELALARHQWVRAVEPGSEDYDEGHIVAIDDDKAMVAWSSGVKTPTPIDDLTLLSG